MSALLWVKFFLKKSDKACIQTNKDWWKFLMAFWIPTLGFFFPPAQLTQANLNTGTLKLFSIETPIIDFSATFPPSKSAIRRDGQPSSYFMFIDSTFNTFVCYIHRKCHIVGSTNCYWIDDWVGGWMVHRWTNGWTRWTNGWMDIPYHPSSVIILQS